MAYRHYYRPKENDPNSVAALERLSKKDLLIRKKTYEYGLTELNKIFDKEDYNFYKNKNNTDKITETISILNDNFDKLENNITLRKRFFHLKGFFFYKESRIFSYYIITSNNLTNNILDIFKKLINLTKADADVRKYNSKIRKYATKAVDDHYIYLVKNPSSYDFNEKNKILTSHDINGFLNRIETDNSGEGESYNTPTDQLGVYEQIFHPKVIYKYFDGWIESKVIEVDENTFEAWYPKKHAFLIGEFFVKFKSLVDIYDLNAVEELLDEEVFNDWKNDIHEFFEKRLRKITLILRSTERKKRLSENLNFVYLLSNKSYQNIYKVGWTSLLPEERAEQLSGETGVLHPFKVVYKKKFKDAEKVEKKIHKKFSKKRIKKNKEYFEINIKELTEYIDSL